MISVAIKLPTIIIIISRLEHMCIENFNANKPIYTDILLY